MTRKQTRRDNQVGGASALAVGILPFVTAADEGWWDDCPAADENAFSEEDGRDCDDGG